MGQGETNVNTEFGYGTEILKFALYNVTSKYSIIYLEAFTIPFVVTFL
jgi:hypothetical protein